MSVPFFLIWPETAAETALAWPQPTNMFYTRIDKELALFCQCLLDLARDSGWDGPCLAPARFFFYTRLDKELALFSATPVLGFGQAVPESGLRAAAGRCACGKCKDLGDVKTLGDATSVHSTKHFTSPSPTEI